MCKVSILVPIYNVEKYLHQCLESVVNQTLKDIEIICINDGSTDNSLSIIKKFAEKDSRIKIIDKKNTGYGHSMNCGLKIAQGEYIGIVESDDFADLDMFETLYNTAKINEVEVIKSNYLRQVQEKYVFAEYLNQQPYNKIFSPLVDNFKLLTCFPNIWSGLYKREFLLENGIYFNETPGASYQDVGFIFKVWFFAKKVFLIKDAFLHYRVDNPNASVKSKNKAFCIFDEFDEIKKFLVKQANVPDTFNYMFSVYKYKEFESNFERIDDQFRFEFFNRTFREFENDDNAKYLNKKYWQDENWQSVQKLIKYKKEFFCDQYKHQQDIHIFREGFFNVLESFRDIYIYGAGKIATSVFLNLFRRQFYIKGILVSDTNNNPNKLAEVPVGTINDFTIDKEKDAILISMKESSQMDIFYNLKAAKYRNVIMMTKALRSALN